jgi:DNA polymerase-3 subunit epsilon
METPVAITRWCCSSLWTAMDGTVQGGTPVIVVCRLCRVATIRLIDGCPQHDEEEGMTKHESRSTGRCPRCQQPADAASAPGFCATHHAVWQEHRRGAVSWARWALASRSMVILDTETTGLDDTSEVIELAVLSTRGEMLFDTLIRPTVPIPQAATAVHHLDDQTVAGAPTFRALHGQLTYLLRRRFVVVYNAAFDRRMLDQSCARSGLPSFRPSGWHCAMLAYARFTGVWNRAKDDYTWHKLQGGDHTALGDCRATLTTLEWMAEVR